MNRPVFQFGFFKLYHPLFVVLLPFFILVYVVVVFFGLALSYITGRLVIIDENWKLSFK